MTAYLVPTGEVTVCCADHRGGPLGACCDRDDCAPCCPECPTCPRCAFYERFHTGWRREAALASRRWRSEAIYTDTWASAQIAAALEFWDRADFRHTSIHPDVPQIVRTYRRIREAMWAEVF